MQKQCYNEIELEGFDEFCASNKGHVGATNALVRHGAATAEQQEGTHLHTGRVAVALCCNPTPKSSLCWIPMLLIYADLTGQALRNVAE